MRKPVLLMAALVAGLAAAPAAQDAAMPRVASVNGRQMLVVDGKPFLILGLQWDCDSCFAREIMDPLFPQAAKLGCNTAVLPLYWREVEPREGAFDFAMLDHRIELARQNGLRIALVWFGTYKNGCLNYAPDFVKSGMQRFRRAQQADGTPLRNFACPTSTETFAADRKALEAVFRHLNAVDASRHTVVLFQMENEAGLLGTDRCYCPVCSKQFTEGDWSRREGSRAAEAFSASSVAKYLDGLTAAVKAIYPLPVYVNAWLRGDAASAPGKGYPSGGPVDRVLDIYKATATHVDFIAPDIYSHARESFTSICRTYAAAGMPLYIAEHSSGKDSRAERNVFYALAELLAIGFSPWAIDRSFPDQDGAPMVHQLDARWSEEAYDLRDSYVPLRDAMVPIALAQGSDRLKMFVQEGGEKQAELPFEGIRVRATYSHKRGLARGVVVRLGAAEFAVLGTGFRAGFVRADGTGAPLAAVERGRFDGETWRAILPIRRESEDRSAPFRVIEPQVVKVTLELPAGNR